MTTSKSNEPNQWWVNWPKQAKCEFLPLVPSLMVSVGVAHFTGSSHQVLQILKTKNKNRILIDWSFLNQQLVHN